MPNLTSQEYSFDKLMAILRCPACRGRLQFHRVDQDLPRAREYGVLTCGCSQYPVIDGICILMKGTVGSFEHTEGHVEYQGPSIDDLTRLVQAGRGLDALLRCIAFPLTIKQVDRIPVLRQLWHSGPIRELRSSLRRVQLRRWCVEGRETHSAEDWLDLFYRQYSPVQGDLFSYFFCRLAQPRHLATLALTSYLPASEKPVLDLACGFGHLGYNLAESSAAHAVIGADRNFFQLWVAQHWIASKNRFVCVDADQTLPFADKSFAATLCCDAFHYFRRKDLVLDEIARCAPGQPILLTGVGNRLVEPTEGFELTPQEYLTVCHNPAWRAFGNTNCSAGTFAERLWTSRQPGRRRWSTARSGCTWSTRACLLSWRVQRIPPAGRTQRDGSASTRSMKPAARTTGCAVYSSGFHRSTMPSRTRRWRASIPRALHLPRKHIGTYRPMFTRPRSSS